MQVRSRPPKRAASWPGTRESDRQAVLRRPDTAGLVHGHGDERPLADSLANAVAQEIVERNELPEWRDLAV